ncbi:hypothetical protein CNR22_20385 [Sphingobacteriaceae bacterium]|nr:hypothetical protein CNR22_20385 [Sphingobacteriaceae bacterium]
MQDTKEITLFIVLTVFAILFLIVLIAVVILWSKRKILEKENKFAYLEKQRQIELIKTIVETEESQKTKIASDLHDQIIPVLTLTALNLITEIEKLEKGSNDFSKVKTTIDNFANLADNVREIAHGIIPKMFTTFGLLKSIEIALKQLNNENIKAVFKDNSLSNITIPLSLNKQLTIYRIFLELLTNLVKHVKYNNLVVSLEEMPICFSLVFTHDGIGITNQTIENLTNQSTGIGLKSLKSRALSLNATIDYSIEKEVSFIILRVPIDHEIIN